MLNFACINRHTWLYVTLLLCAIHICINVVWIMQNEDFMEFDVFEHLARQERYFVETNNIMHSSDPILFKTRNVIALFFRSELSNIQFPGMAYLITVLQKLLIGNHCTLPFIANSIYLIILLLSTYAIGTYCVDGFFGFLAAFVLSTSPQIASIARYYGLDYPLMALVACSFWVLLKTDYFQNKSYSILFSVLCAIGILIKGQYIMFMFPACLLYLFYAFIHKKITLGKIIILCALLFGIIIFMTQLWWKGNAASLLRLLWSHVISFYGDTPKSIGFYAGQSLFYLRSTLIAMFPFYFIIFLSALGYVVIRRPRLPETMKVLLWFCVSAYVIFSMISIKLARYLFPAYFGYALLISFFVCQMVSKRAKKIMVISILIVGCLQVTVMSFGPKRIYDWVRNGFVEKISEHDRSGLWVELPHRSNIRSLVKALARNIDARDKEVLLLNASYVDQSRTLELEYYLRHERPDLSINSGPWFGFQDLLMSADYIVLSQNSEYERALMGGPIIYDDPAMHMLQDTREQYAFLWMGEVCSRYGEPIRNMILIKKVA